MRKPSAGDLKLISNCAFHAITFERRSIHEWYVVQNDFKPQWASYPTCCTHCLDMPTWLYTTNDMAAFIRTLTSKLPYLGNITAPENSSRYKHCYRHTLFSKVCMQSLLPDWAIWPWQLRGVICGHNSDYGMSLINTIAKKTEQLFSGINVMCGGMWAC